MQKKSRQDEKEDGGSLLSCLDFYNSIWKYNVTVSSFSEINKIKVTEDSSILPSSSKWENMPGI